MGEKEATPQDPSDGIDLTYSLPLNWLGNLHWRTGRSVGRTIYAQLGALPGDEDILIGMLDSRDLASEAVYGHNLHLYVISDHASTPGDVE